LQPFSAVLGVAREAKPAKGMGPSARAWTTEKILATNPLTPFFSVSKAAMNAFAEVDWENLLTFIDEGSVIAVVGNELSIIADPDSGRPILFEEWLGQQLAQRMGGGAPPPGTAFQKIVCQLLQAGRKPMMLQATVKRILDEHNFPPPEPLRLLAEITDFRLFVTTALDNLLEKSLFEFAPTEGPEVLAYGPKRHEDVAGSLAELPQRTVYHLFGRADKASGAAISEEDMVEWLAAWQMPDRSPPRLGALLETNHLLLLSPGYRGWLARFFLRAAKRRPLRDEREHQEFLVDAAVLNDPDLVLFLRTQSKSTILVEDTSSITDFIRELHRRWVAQKNRASQHSRPVQNIFRPIRYLPPAREMPPQAVFISYSRKTDLEAAKRLKAAFDEAAIPAWFDLEGLQAGHDYEAKIKQAIERCSYFVPIISKAALDREEGFFFKEWWMATKRLETMGDQALFIFPCVKCENGEDAMSLLNDRRIPEPIRRIHGSRVFTSHEANPGLELVQQIRSLMKVVSA
jgi:hypothetical protein